MLCLGIRSIFVTLIARQYMMYIILYIHVYIYIYINHYSMNCLPKSYWNKHILYIITVTTLITCRINTEIKSNPRVTLHPTLLHSARNGCRHRCACTGPEQNKDVERHPGIAELSKLSPAQHPGVSCKLSPAQPSAGPAPCKDIWILLYIYIYICI